MQIGTLISVIAFILSSEPWLGVLVLGVVMDFRDVFETERRIFRLKLSSKFALNAISGTGAVGVLFLGGWLVLNGRSDVGTVMASLTGLARIDGPWRELVSFFRNASTVRVKYAMLVRAITHRESERRASVRSRAGERM